MSATDLLHKYLDVHKGLYHLVYDHSRLVADKALTIARTHPELHVDMDFLEDASLLHDIGVFMTNAPGICCFGTFPYICHGYLGREILESEGLIKQALVCERHIGTGLTMEEIICRVLPLPSRNMLPVSIEEQIICFSDLFFSKTKPEMERSLEAVRIGLEAYGQAGLNRFNTWCRLFI